jgi:hypothetical protein
MRSDVLLLREMGLSEVIDRRTDTGIASSSTPADAGKEMNGPFPARAAEGVVPNAFKVRHTGNTASAHRCAHWASDETDTVLPADEQRERPAKTLRVYAEVRIDSPIMPN